MNYVAIFHANLNYAFLEPHKYEQTIRASYETIVDTFREKAPDQRYVFEASGYTIDMMAEYAPDVLQKFKDAIGTGQCEFMGAPYSHPIMANIPEEDGYWSNEFAMRTYEKHLGFRPESVWNPECTWMQYVPRAFRKAGYKYLTLDFESYMNCTDKDYAWVERNRTHDMNWGGNLPWYDLDPSCKFLHRPFRDVVPGLHGFCRSDRLVGKYVGYFLDRLPLEEYIENVQKWTGDDKKGATIIIADDAEYCGTTGYFFVKYFQDYSRSFTADPKAGEKLAALIEGIKGIGGQLITFKEACELEPVEEPFFVEDRYAWHRTYADAWAGTPEARAWDPILAEIRREYKRDLQPITEGTHKDQFKDLVDTFWLHLTNSANSDGRWPPPPALTCPFNRQWVLDEIEKTKQVLAELKQKAGGIALPDTGEELTPSDSTTYDYYFTDKAREDVTRLNLYELSHELYAAYKFFDNGEDKAAGKARIALIYDEFKKRGFDKVVTPAALQ